MRSSSTIILGMALALPGFATANTVMLADLVRTDDLGYECVEEANLELAFAASGKGLRLPRTCLPEPCDVLSRDRLGQEIIGRPPDMSEWDTYYARYAEYCRAETTVFEGHSRRATAAQFWTPLRGDVSPVVALLPPISDSGPFSSGGVRPRSGAIVFPRAGFLFPISGGREQPDLSGQAIPPTGPTMPGSIIVTTPEPHPEADLGPEPDTITAVPLPGSLWLLALVMTTAALFLRATAPARIGVRET